MLGLGYTASSPSGWSSGPYWRTRYSIGRGSPLLFLPILLGPFVTHTGPHILRAPPGVVVFHVLLPSIWVLDCSIVQGLLALLIQIILCPFLALLPEQGRYGGLVSRIPLVYFLTNQQS